MKAIIKQLTDDINIKYPLNEEKFFNIRLVLSELIMNAFKHSKSGDFVDVYLECGYSEDKIRIIVEDYGYGFNLKSADREAEANDIYNNGGRGITLVRALCEKVKYNDTGNSVSVVMSV